MKSLLSSIFSLPSVRKKQRNIAVINDFLDELDRYPLVASRDRDPREDTKYYAFRRAVGSRDDYHLAFPHPALTALGKLLQKEPCYRALIDIRSITAVSASKGELIAELDTLPETMSFSGCHKPSFGPFSSAEMKKLRYDVYREFDPGMTSKHGLFSITDITWCQERIAGNAGASRRFSLWRRLASRDGYNPTRIRALMHPISLNEAAFSTLVRDWRFIRVSRHRALERVLVNLSQAWPEGVCIPDYSPSWQDRRNEYWIIPKLHKVPPEVQERFTILHAQLDLAGVEDILRTVSEDRSFARRSRVRAAKDIILQPARQMKEP